MIPRRNALAIFLGFALVGCSDSDKSVTAPQLRPATGTVIADREDGGESDEAQQAKEGKAIEWVHGSIVFMAAPDTPERIANHARKSADGVVQGRFEAKDDLHRITGSIVCFSVAGNTVRLAGRAERSNAPLVPPGTYIIWSQVDNDLTTNLSTNRSGPDRKRAPDETSQIVLANEVVAMDHCNVGLNVAPLYPAIKGSVELYPEVQEHKH